MKSEEIRKGITRDRHGFFLWNGDHLNEREVTFQHILLQEIAAQLAELNENIREVMGSLRLTNQ